MILDAITLTDCAVFVIFLAPQLIIQVGLGTTIGTLLRMLPFLLISLPHQLLFNDILAPRESKPPFHAKSNFFTNLVIRCVRFAFAHLPARVGAVFFSKPVALPFAQWRMLRNGIWPSPYRNSFFTRLAVRLGFKRPDCFWEERTCTPNGLKAVWMVRDPSKPPDIALYYIHGGGFSMGSPWFYLEFCLAWMHLLGPDASPTADKKRTHYENPAVLAVDYSLVPDRTHPTQEFEVQHAYRYLLDQLPARAQGDPPSVELAGDSAGATLALSLLLLLAADRMSDYDEALHGPFDDTEPPVPLPAHATLISPWCRLVSDLNRDTPSDYLNADSLHLYARQYVSDTALPKTFGYPPPVIVPLDSKRLRDMFASPADCTHDELWIRAMPAQGIHFVHGAEEVFAPESRALAARLRKIVGEAGGKKSDSAMIRETEEPAQIHAWPVVNLFLADKTNERLRGLKIMAEEMLSRKI